MGISSSLFAGISGLSTHGNAMSVIGDNIANVNTIGFKSSRTSFQDVLSQSVSTASGTSQIGRGTTLSSVGTLFQQVLIIANTTRKLEATILEAARTLGTRGARLVTKVVLPGILPDLYRDQRILLGWAWTYLIVAELIGTSSGITWYITQQARYQHFDNVYAAIMIIGVLGFGIDLLLARLGRRLFPWDRTQDRR